MNHQRQGHEPLLRVRHTILKNRTHEHCAAPRRVLDMVLQTVRRKVTLHHPLAKEPVEVFIAILLSEWGFLRALARDRKSTRLNSSHSQISYAVFCLKKKNITFIISQTACSNTRRARYRSVAIA